MYLEYTAAGNWSDVTSKAGQDDVIKAHIQSMEFCARIVLPVASNRAKRSVFRTVNILGALRATPAALTAVDPACRLRTCLSEGKYCALRARTRISQLTRGAAFPSDMRGLSMGMFSKDVLEIFSKVAEIDKNHYPETLHQVHMQ